MQVHQIDFPLKEPQTIRFNEFSVTYEPNSEECRAQSTITYTVLGKELLYGDNSDSVYINNDIVQISDPEKQSGRGVQRLSMVLEMGPLEYCTSHECLTEFFNGESSDVDEPCWNFNIKASVTMDT